MGISKFHSRNNSQNYSLPLCSSIDRQDVLRFQEARDSREPSSDDRAADQVFAAARPQLQGGDILPLGGAGRERDGDGLRADKGAGVRRARPPRPQRSAAVQPDLGEHRQMDMRAGAGLLQGQRAGDKRQHGGVHQGLRAGGSLIDGFPPGRPSGTIKERKR